MRGALSGFARVSAALLTGLLLLEVAVRVVAPQQLIVPGLEIYQPAREIGWTHRANVRTIVNTGDGPSHFRTDANGFRIPWNQADGGPPPDLRILAVGDSYLEATAVEAEATVPEVLRARLEAALNRRIAIDNAGVGAWGLTQILMQARRSLATTRYDLGLVFLDGPDDEIADSYAPRQIARTHAFRLPRNLRKKEWINSVFYPANDFLKSHSHLYLFLKARLRVPLARLGLTAEAFPPYFERRDAGNRHWDTAVSLCTAIRQEFSSHGVPVVFVLVPASYQVDSRIFDEYVRSFSIRRDTVDLDQPGRLLGARLKSAAFTVLDPLATMRERNAQGTRLYGDVDRHLNAAGQRVLADLLFPVVRKELPERPPGR